MSYALDAAAGATRLVNSVELDPSQAKLRLLAPLATQRSKRQWRRTSANSSCSWKVAVQHKDFCRGNAIGTVKANYFK